MERKDTFDGDGELLWIILNDGKKIHFLDVVQKIAYYQKHNHAVGTETRFDWALQNKVGRSYEPSNEIIPGKECELYSIPMDGGTVTYAGFANIMFLTGLPSIGCQDKRIPGIPTNWTGFVDRGK